MKTFQKFLEENEISIPKFTDQYHVYDSMKHGEIKVQRHHDGTYYGQADKFDFEAKNDKHLREKLKNLNAEHVGYERIK
jgi:hypothetical protein